MASGAFVPRLASRGPLQYVSTMAGCSISSKAEAACGRTHGSKVETDPDPTAQGVRKAKERRAEAHRCARGRPHSGRRREMAPEGT